MTLTYKLVIKGRLDGLNEFIAAQRSNKYKGAALKKRNQAKVEDCIRHQLGHIHLHGKVKLHYQWFEANKRRDLDNVSGFGHKVIQDALVECGVLDDDSPQYVIGYTDAFAVDRVEPRIEVRIEEID